MYDIISYNSNYKPAWDQFVKNSKNGTFLFLRDYMDYHSDRFVDHSFLFFKKKKLIAILPGNVTDYIFYSHQGLTYGGLILSKEISTKEVLEIFTLLNLELKNKDIKEVIYKAIPYIYQRAPAQEDIYALFRLKATKISCTISSTIFQANKLKFSESRKSGLRKSLRENVFIKESNDYQSFLRILNENLYEKYKLKAVHSFDEIILLSNRFPDNIKLFLACKEDVIVAGTMLYIMENIIHVQYMAASEEGKLLGALDFLFDKLINDLYKNCRIFDFGHSSENNGNYLNENLIFQKEGFGGRGVVYEAYSYLIE